MSVFVTGAGVMIRENEVPMEFSVARHEAEVNSEDGTLPENTGFNPDANVIE